MCVKLQCTGYGEPGIFGLGKMSKFKVGPVQIAQEALRLQVVGPVALHCAAILEEGKFRQVDVLPGEGQGCGQAVIGLPFDGSALQE